MLGKKTCGSSTSFLEQKRCKSAAACRAQQARRNPEERRGGAVAGDKLRIHSEGVEMSGPTAPQLETRCGEETRTSITSDNI